MRLLSWHLRSMHHTRCHAVHGDSNLINMLERLDVEVFAVQSTNCLSPHEALVIPSMPHVFHELATSRYSNLGVSIYSKYPGEVVFTIDHRAICVRVGPLYVVSALGLKAVTGMGYSNRESKESYMLELTAKMKYLTDRGCQVILLGNLSVVVTLMDSYSTSPQTNGRRVWEMAHMHHLMQQTNLADPWRTANPAKTLWTYQKSTDTSADSRNATRGWRTDIALIPKQWVKPSEERPAPLANVVYLRWETSRHKPLLLDLHAIAFV